MSEFYITKLVGILSEIQYATLATVSDDGDPYNAPVFTAYDDILNFYWSSSPSSQHSQNITHNGKVFIVIYKSVVAQGTGWGAYIKATATTASSQETMTAVQLLGRRRGRPFTGMEHFGPDGPQKIYKATPTHIWINDAKKDANGEYIADYREEISIDALRNNIIKSQ